MSLAKSLYLVSLGCPKNLVDSEVMLGLLEQHGYEIASDAASADLLMVNTCGFIGSAAEEAVEAILELADYKKADPGKKLVVTGCLVQRYGRDLQKELPEVDLFIGTDGVPDIVAFISGIKQCDLELLQPGASSFLMNASMPRRTSTPPHRAYLKITEGCSNQCTYCLIPSIRGRLRSRPISDLTTEAGLLAGDGVQELTLIAQDLMAFGRDLGEGQDIIQLLTALLDRTDIPWIRLLYLHPARLTPDFFTFMASQPRLLPYLDIPLQHVNDRILKLMNRPYTSAMLKKIITTARAAFSRVALRTTLMVGFPGETEEDFQEMKEFVRLNRFDNLGVFAYENEEGCRAASLPDHCDEDTKQARRHELMEIQRRISREKLHGLIGSTQMVLVEGVSHETELLLEGRTKYQAADIDGCIYIAAGNAKQGEIVEVRVTDAHDYDLVGEITTPD